MVDLVNIALPIVKSILFAIVVLIVGLLIIKWVTKLVGKILDNKHVDVTLKPFIKSIISVILKLLLVVAIIGDRKSVV